MKYTQFLNLLLTFIWTTSVVGGDVGGDVSGDVGVSSIDFEWTISLTTTAFVFLKQNHSS